ncbi:procathepsin L isoform X6 [Astyanax mexicanus]|uniref:procathepsin L isoform X6 n=1 Tax=Astyanax mexicanus TaxID=7994 RepID=UPI0020CAED51|nr:procathepsin L isoform X6 [Astyanax mexicanus]XP_049320215.1 procathepsin L isoform X6 [Astyanax mexicanus]
MRVLLAVAAFVVVAGAASVSVEDLEFNSWKLQHGKSYDSEEEESQRKMIWLNNRKLVLEHNMLADQGLKSYRLGMNIFADMENQEFQAMFSHCVKSFNETDSLCTSTFLSEEEDTPLPRRVDWRQKGYITDVKNQRSCGSCWAFSATGALEGQMFRKTGKLISLSEKQLVDCSQSFGNLGCNGGWPSKSFEYIKSNQGLEADFTYPYKAREETCRFNPQRVMATCSGFECLPQGDENALKKAVAKIGPISVLIDTSKHTFQLYKSGVYDEPGCSSTRLTHAVLLVGYGNAPRGKQYWLVKNSWSTSWGEAGYIRMSRNKNNQCGIATFALYPEV